MRPPSCSSRSTSTLEGFTVPFCQRGSGIVGGLQKVHECSFGRGSHAHVVVHQQVLFQLRMVESRCWPHTLLRKTGWLRRGVGIESRALDVATAGPEPGAADLVGIRFAGDAIGARPLRRHSSRETRNRMIEAAPPEM